MFKCFQCIYVCICLYRVGIFIVRTMKSKQEKERKSVCVGVRMYVSDNRKHHGKSAPFVCMCNSNRYRCMYDEHRKRKRRKQNKKKTREKGNHVRKKRNEWIAETTRKQPTSAWECVGGVNRCPEKTLFKIDRRPSTVFSVGGWMCSITKQRGRVDWTHCREREREREEELEHQMFIHVQMRMRNLLFILCCH